MKKIAYLLLILVVTMASVQSCKKSNSNDNNGTTTTNPDPNPDPDPDPDPQPSSLLLGKWTTDSMVADVYYLGQYLRTQKYPVAQGSFIDFYNDSMVATYDGTVMDTSDYVNMDDQKVLMNFLGSRDTIDILDLTETSLLMYTEFEFDTAGFILDIKGTAYNSK